MTLGRGLGWVRTPAAALLLGLPLALLPAAPALGVIPAAPKVRAEMARRNVQAGRTRPLVLDLLLVGESGGAIASGRARLDPGGMAWLELIRSDGGREVHERSPAGYAATRDGVRLDRAMPLLPPTQLLQAPTEAEVAAALEGIGGDPEQLDLGLCDDADCWVLGGRDPGSSAERGRPSYWFDLESRQPVRIDEPRRARYRFGPSVARDGSIAFPAWIEVEAPGWSRRRLEVQRVAPAGPTSRPPGP